MKELLETRYIRYCDPSKPLELFTMLYCRFSLNVGQFMAYHPRRWKTIKDTPESEKQYVWHICLRLLEQFIMLQTSEHLQQFSWHVAYYLQWHVFIHVLDTLRATPLRSDAEKAWRLVESLYGNNPD